MELRFDGIEAVHMNTSKLSPFSSEMKTFIPNKKLPLRPVREALLTDIMKA